MSFLFVDSSADAFAAMSTPDADQQLMKCCEWLRQQGTPAVAAALYAAMRPPKSPHQRAMEALTVLEQLHGPSQPLNDLRNALEDVPEDID